MPAPFDRGLAAGVWAVDAREARDTLSTLLAWSLLDYDPQTGLYGVHDLLRDLAGEPDPAAAARHARAALDAARRAEAAFEEGGEHIAPALARFDRLWPHLRAAWSRQQPRAATGDPEAQRWVRDFGWDFIHLLDLRTTPAERLPYLQAAVEAARALGDRRAEGALLGNLGLAYADLGRVEEAIGYYQQALAIAREIGDRRGEGNRLGSLGLAYAALGRVEEAIGYYEQALAIAREIGDRRGKGIHAWNLGLIYEQKGDYARAARLMQILVDYERALGHPDAEAHARRLAEVRRKVGL